MYIHTETERDTMRVQLQLTSSISPSQQIAPDPVGCHMLSRGLKGVREETRQRTGRPNRFLRLGDECPAPLPPPPPSHTGCGG